MENIKIDIDAIMRMAFEREIESIKTDEAKKRKFMDEKNSEILALKNQVKYLTKIIVANGISIN